MIGWFVRISRSLTQIEVSYTNQQHFSQNLARNTKPFLQIPFQEVFSGKPHAKRVHLQADSN
jgi:hypothetical protein